MRKPQTTHIRVHPEVRKRLTELELEISAFQKERVQMPEIIRRISNIPNLKTVLINDALNKKRLASRGK